MIRGIAEAIGWFIAILALANLAGLVEFRLYLAAPTPVLCPQEPSMKLNLDQLKREARRLSKTQPLTHSQALEKLARAEGFRNYAALRASLKETT